MPILFSIKEGPWLATAKRELLPPPWLIMLAFAEPAVLVMLLPFANPVVAPPTVVLLCEVLRLLPRPVPLGWFS